MNKSSILIFDGDCLFCNWVAFHLAKADKRNRFRFVASTGEAGKRIINEHNLQELVKQTVIVKIGKDIFIKSEAVYQFLKESQTYPMFRFLMRLFPRFLADFFYDLIAKNRKKIIRTECPMPNAEILKKFLND